MTNIDKNNDIMTTLILKSNVIFKETAMIISYSIQKILTKNELAVVGIAGGKSISKTLDELVKKQIDWKRVQIFLVDERLVPVNHSSSNFKMVEEKFSKIIPKSNLHPFSLNPNKNDYGLEEYNDAIKKFNNKFDIAIVSSGDDGHIGSLFPHHLSIYNESENYIFVDNSPKPPLKRISASRKMIIRSKVGILMIIGDNKELAHAKFFDKEINYIVCPSKLINEIPENFIITDIDYSGEKK